MKNFRSCALLHLHMLLFLVYLPLWSASAPTTTERSQKASQMACPDALTNDVLYGHPILPKQDMLKAFSSMKGFIAQKPEDIDQLWAQKVVDAYQLGIRVNKVTVVGTHFGTTTRVRVIVEHNGPLNFPRNWFIKLPSKYKEMRIIAALTLLLSTEVRYYKGLAFESGLPRLTFLGGDTGRLGYDGTLIFGDLNEFDGRPGRPYDTLDLREAKTVIAQMAQLHGQFWESPEIDHLLNWQASLARRLENFLGMVLAEKYMKRGLKEAGTLVPESLQKDLIRYAKNRKEILSFLSEGPCTIVHHDSHPGNITWYGSRPIIIDWQLCRKGEGIGDLALLLALGMAPTQRKEHERDLITNYQNILKSTYGVEDLDFETMLKRYSAHLIYPLEAMIMTLGFGGGLMEREANIELIRRAVAAVIANDTMAILFANPSKKGTNTR